MSSESKLAGLNPPAATAAPLLPLPPHCVEAAFVQRRKRFSVLLQHQGADLWVHSNNSGSMLGLCQPGAPVLASPASNPDRKLKYTQECVWLAHRAVPQLPQGTHSAPDGFWVGVNTSTPNRMHYPCSRGQTRSKQARWPAHRPRPAAPVGGVQKRHHGRGRRGLLS